MNKNLIVVLTIFIVLGIGTYVAYVSNQNKLTVQATATPTLLAQGQSSVILWSSTGATSCNVSSANGEGDKVATSGSAEVPIFSNMLPITVTCSDEKGKIASATIDFTMKPSDITVQVTAVPNRVSQGQDSTITWSSTGASGCYLSSVSEARNEIGTSGSAKGPVYSKGLPAKITCYDAGGNTKSVDLDLAIKP